LRPALIPDRCTSRLTPAWLAPAGDPGRRLHMYRTECLDSVLDVQADCVDHAADAGNGSFYRMRGMDIGDDPHDTVVLDRARMP
jgi:hypothetical protein